MAYDGTAFAGWQVQPGHRTVQGVLQESLDALRGGKPGPVHGAGRTDAGAHARWQTADASLPEALSDDAVAHALSRMLPEDLRVWRVSTVGEDFHARFSAKGKRYVYVIDRRRSADPFRARFALHLPGPFDRAAIDAALALLPGRRDWSGFTSAACDVDDRVRTIHLAGYDEVEGDVATFRFEGEGFLTYMVRNLVGTLLDVGRGRFPPERVTAVLKTGDRSLAGPTASAHGLFLDRVDYDDDGDTAGLAAPVPPWRGRRDLG